MGGLKGLTSPVYLDANVFIYALEGYSQFKSRVAALLTAIDRHDIEAVTSELTVAEVLVKPFRDRHAEQQAAYQRILQTTPTFHMVPVSRDILVTAAQLRGRFAVKLPDAIHAATSQQCRCSTFLTNDARFKTMSDLPVVLFSEWQP